MQNMSLFYGLALVTGVVAGIYLPLNSRFGEQVGSPLLATSVFFTVGAFIAWGAFGLFAPRKSLAPLGEVDPPLLYLGIISFGIIFAATVLIPKIGPGAYAVCVVAGQVLAGLALSHYGLLAPAKLPMTPIKWIGAIAIVGGVLLIRYAEERALASKTDPPVASNRNASSDL